MRYALRLLGRSPVFTVVAILTLGLGIGANSAIFTLVDAVVLRPLPIPDAEQVVVVWEDSSSIGFPKNTPAPGNVWDWRAENTVFSKLAATMGAGATITGTGAPESLVGRAVEADFFAVFGVAPVFGRVFTAKEDAEREALVVLSWGLFQRRLGGEAKAIGTKMILNGEPFTVIGVMPAQFRFPVATTEYWVPLSTNLQPPRRSTRDSHFLNVFARMKPGVTIAQAQTEMTGIAGRLEKQYPGSNTKVGAVVEPMKEFLGGNTSTALWVLLGAAGAVLLIACANLANLLLSRNVGRRKELAVRLALGASRGQILGQLTKESLLLAGLGGLAGAGISLAAQTLLVTLIPASLQAVAAPRFDARQFLFLLAVTAGTGLLFGLLPALQAARRDIQEGLKAGSRTGVGEGRANSRAVLVVLECALTIVLLAGAGLLIKTLARLTALDPGFATENLLTMVTPLNRPPYTTDAAKRTAFYTAVLERVKALPGVKEAAFTFVTPFTQIGNTNGFRIEGLPEPPLGSPQDALYRSGTPSYLRMLGPQLLEGRLWDEQDRSDTQAVVVLNETMARHFFPSGGALGRRVKISRDGVWRNVIGVVRDIRERGYETPLKFGVYVPGAQSVETGLNELMVRTAGDPLLLQNAVRREIQAVDKDQPVVRVRTMDAILDQNVANRRQQTVLLGCFAGLALLLAVVGLYGVLAYMVSQRRREIGLRMALGATRGNIVGWVMAGGLRLVGLGLLLGLGAAIGMSRLLRSMLVGVDASDPTVYAVVTVALFLVSAVACFVPANRAARIDPMDALREE